MRGEVYAGHVSPRSGISTSVLLTCAAIGVATGAVSAGAGAVSGLVSAAVPVLYGLVLGVHVLPGVIAQVLLRMPWVALISHVLAALVASAFVPPWIGRYIGTAILIGGLQELIAAIGRYRHWERWRYFVSAVIVGLVLGGYSLGAAVTDVVLAVPIALVADLGRFAPWAQVVYIAMFIVGPVAWTAVAVAIGEALRRAGVGRTARRR